MDNQLVLTNAVIITESEVFSGTIALSDGRIVDLCSGSVSFHGARDMEGDFLLPGLVELHTDNLETKFMPRPKVLWPAPLTALLAHDNEIIGAGITTVLNGICCGQMHEGKMRHTLLGMSMRALRTAWSQKILRAEHLLHLRCEVCDPHVLEMFAPYSEEPNLALVSLMDHTPGQRQFSRTDKYREYYSHMAWDDQEFETLVKELKVVQESCAPHFRSRILDICRKRGLPVASHDDTVPEHVRVAADEGVSISEFPTTLEAAREAHRLGLAVVAGGPNVVRNGSHSGNVSARELAREGLLDVLSSDYVPRSLVHAAFLLNSEEDIPLPESVAMVSANPARVLGMGDRGLLGPGKRADLVRVRMVDDQPVIMNVWRGGRRLL